MAAQKDNLVPSPSTVGCFSYLARVHTLNVDHHPHLNYGVAINSQDWFLAGDGPLVAGLLSRFGHSTALGANHPADDDPGRAILCTLHEWDVTLLPGPQPRTAARTNIVACDRGGNRTWYGDLHNVDDELATVDIAALVSHDVVYIDGYDVLGHTPHAVLNAATRAGRYTLLNLGGSVIPEWLTDLHGPVDVLQTNGPETNLATVDTLLNTLVALEVADLVVVTAGRHGGRAADAQGQQWTVPAINVDAKQPQGAGAAFSAALIHTAQTDMDVDQRLRLACATGSLWCTRSTTAALPSLAEVAAFQHEHTAGPVATPANRPSAGALAGEARGGGRFVCTPRDWRQRLTYPARPRTSHMTATFSYSTNTMQARAADTKERLVSDTVAGTDITDGLWT